MPYLHYRVRKRDALFSAPKPFPSFDTKEAHLDRRVALLLEVRQPAHMLQRSTHSRCIGNAHHVAHRRRRKALAEAPRRPLQRRHKGLARQRRGRHVARMVLELRGEHGAAEQR
eukprot:361895-Chlamydomonas_euryale.AAC.9